MSVKKNYIYNLSYTLLNFILPLITAPYIARIMGVESVGIYSTNYAVAHYFYIAAKLGLTNYGAREIAGVRNIKEKLNRTFSEIYNQQFLVASSATVLYIIYCLIVRNNENLIVIILMGIFVIHGLIEIDWLYAGLEQFKSISRKNILVKIVGTILIFALVKGPQDLWLYTAILGLSTFGGAAVMWLGLRKRVILSRVPIKTALRHLKPSITFLIPVIATSVYRTLDKILLGTLGSMSMAGYYEFAEKIIYALCGLITAYGTVIMPRLSNYAAEGKNKESEKMIKMSMMAMMMLMCGVSFGLAAISMPLSLTLYGSTYSETGTLMFGLSFTLIFMAWANIIRQTYIIPRHHEKIFIMSVSVGAIVDFILDIILIPLLGGMGAVIGTIVAELAVPVTQYINLRKEVNYRELFVSAIPSVLSGGIMFAIVRIIGKYLNAKSEILELCIMIATGMIVYCGAIVVFELLFNKTDFKRLISSLISRGRKKQKS